MDQENSDRKREGGDERTQLHVFTHIYVHLALVPFYMKLQIFIIYMYLELNVVRQRNRFLMAMIENSYSNLSFGKFQRIQRD